MNHWGLRRFALNAGLLALTGMACSNRVSADPAEAKAGAAQIYQGELDGQQVWVELTRTAHGVSGKLVSSSQSASALTTLELPPPVEHDGPPTFVPQGLDATQCVLRIAGTHPNGLKSACLQSMQGAAFLTEGFPELILEDDPSSPGKQFWLRAVARESAENLAEFGDELRQAQPKARNACARSVRVDQLKRTEIGTFLGYWTWDFCGSAVLSAARAGNADAGKGPWRETAWLGMVDPKGRLVARVAVGQRMLANDQLSVTELGRLGGFNVVSVEQSYQDAYPTGVSTSSQTRIYAASDRGPFTLALGPLLSHETSGNCSGSDLVTQWFWMRQVAEANELELIVRTTKTNRVRIADACEARDRVTYGGYRFNARTATYTGFYRSDFAELVKRMFTL